MLRAAGSRVHPASFRSPELQLRVASIARRSMPFANYLGRVHSWRALATAPILGYNALINPNA